MAVDIDTSEARKVERADLIRRATSVLLERTEAEDPVVTARQRREVIDRIFECFTGAGDGVPFPGSHLCRDEVVVPVYDFTQDPGERAFLMTRILRALFERLADHYERPYLARFGS